MATNYPGGVDDFGVPSLPEETPLSSGGDSSRAHTQLHLDEGDAIEALQANAALKGHDHSGDAADIHKGPKLTQANTHQSADTDNGNSSLHHTLGTGPHQAMPGNRVFDYSELVNVPLKICTSTTRPGAPVQGMIIYETNTKCWRQWDLFANNVVVAGLNSTINFNEVNASTPGAGWNVGYDFPSGGGHVATDGTYLKWVEEGDDANKVVMRRTDASDAVTQTDDQIITWKTGDEVIQYPGILTGDSASNDAYFRTNSAGTSYVRVEAGTDFVRLWYTTSGAAGETQLGIINGINTELINTEWRATLIDRTFSLYRTGQLMGTITDTRQQTAKGAANRGWGIGMTAGNRVNPWSAQTSPANIDWVRIQDQAYYASTNRWTILPLGAIPVVRLRQSKNQKLINSGTVIEFSEELEDSFGFFDKNTSQTNVVVREPGLYRIEAALQWDPQYVPDVAHAVVMLNSQETTIRDSKFMRGNVFQPGFSQTLSLSAPLRLAEGDVINLKAKYTASGGLLSQIFSFFDSSSKVNSRLDLTYIGP